MIVDVLRSGSLTKARGFADSDEEVWLRWFKCQPGAKPYPGWLWSGNPMWEPFPNFSGPGVHNRPAIYRPMTLSPSPGLHYHGQPEWFENGLPHDQLSLEPIADYCGIKCIDPRGGATVGGDASIEPEIVHVSLIVEKTTIPVSGGSLNNLALGEGTCYRLDATGTLVITGFADGLNGRMIVIENVGTSPIYLLDQNVDSEPPNRLICIDGFSSRITPNFAAWFQYDGTSLRWREIATVPFLRAKGDLLTHTLTTPARLPVSEDPTHVLRANPATETGLQWGPESAGGKSGPDLNYYRQFGFHRFGGRHFYTGTYADQRNAGPAVYPSDKIWAQAFISPQAGTIEKVYGYITTVGTGSNAIQIGIYSNTADWDLYPKDLLAFSEAWSGDILGAKETSLEVDLEKDQLYWIVGISQNNSSGSTAACYTTPAFGGWPLYGQAGGTGFGGHPLNNIILADWAYVDGLPLIFPEGGLINLTPVVPNVGLAYAEHS